MNWLEGREILNQKRREFKGEAGRKNNCFANVIVALVDSDCSWYLMIDDELIQGNDVNEIEKMFSELVKKSKNSTKLDKKKYCIWTFDTYSLYWNLKDLFDKYGFTYMNYNSSHKILILENDMFEIRDIGIRLNKSREDFAGMVKPEEEVKMYAEWVKNELSIMREVFPNKIPTTPTNSLKKRIKEKCDNVMLNKYNYYGYYCKSKTWNYLDWSNEEIVDIFSSAFQGGFMTFNEKYYGKSMAVRIYDRCSAYPANLLTSMLPVRFKRFTGSEQDFLYSTIGNKNITLGVYQFYGIRLKKDKMPYIATEWLLDSEDAAECRGIKRLYSAKSIIISAYDLTYKDIIEYYDYDKVTVLDKFIADIAEVDKEFKDIILDSFKNKTIYKNVKGKENEYRISKEYLNSCFGILGEKLIRNGEYRNPCEIKDKSLFYYPWGGYIAAIQRRYMARLAQELGDLVVYSNTDSFVCVDNPRVDEIMKRWNDTFYNNVLRFAGYPISETTARTINNTSSTIGLFELECVTDNFRFVGINRYYYYKNNELVIKFSGIENISKKLTNLGNFRESVDSIFDRYIEGGKIIVFEGAAHYSQGKKYYRPIVL